MTLTQNADDIFFSPADAHDEHLSQHLVSGFGSLNPGVLFLIL
jgi:hypothetical protein